MEKQLPMYFGLEQLNYKRITEYMKIAELIIEEVLNSIIITFYNNEQEERLKAIIMAENLWIELPDGIQKMTEDEKKLFLSTDVIRFCMDR